ncbi:GTPase HflX [Haladaptatus sp. DYF46]|uniref:GTPase HflX n=1 Tax=Haladaptatus sp. DYF46 TaxID=2886041 RepID=UPI001E46F864|nr:GTPase HflX [Haladaptatus sp. DYF46]
MQSGSAIIAKRADDGLPKTDEISALADAAGFEVIGTITQSRTEDTNYQFGRGTAEELAKRIANSDADSVIFDNPLSPQQTFEIGELCPDGTRIIDRYRLVLEIFAEQAGTKEAQLQVKLAELRYELPRVQAEIRLEKEVANERRSRNGLGEKEDRRITDIRDRIETIETKLDNLSDIDGQRREKRREEGFSFVALAGYTNAGKSTLLRRLADEMEISPERHEDLHESAGVEDRLFKTLETTTRRAEVHGRRTLVTDTVGFIRDLPHWLVESFETTLTETYEADLVCLVADVSDPVGELREKLRTSHDLLDDEVERVVTVLNKADGISSTEIDDRLAGVADFAPNPVVVSAIENNGLDTLEKRIADELPPLDEERIRLPNTSDGMALLSWLHDHARVEDVRYPSGERVVVEFAAVPSVAKRATAKADAMVSGG